jgi:DNA-binding IclR family transcriptional regulator
MSPHSKDRYVINSILRASNILKSFLGGKTHYKITELARHLGLDRSTTYRLLLSLEKCGLVEKDERTGEYSLGMTAFEVGNTYLRQMDFIQASKAVMAALAAKVQETVHLAVLSGTEIVYVDKVDSPRALGVISKIGQRGPLHSTALGKVLLAFQPEVESSRLIKQMKLKPFTASTISSKTKLMDELKKIRRQGYGFDLRESEPDVECIAAPIRNHLGDIVAALSISGPQRKIDTPREKEFVSSVVKAAAQVSFRLGFGKAKEEVIKNQEKGGK